PIPVALLGSVVPMTPGDSPDLEVAPIGVTATTGGVGRGRPFTFARDHAAFQPGLAAEGGVTHAPAREDDGWITTYSAIAGGEHEQVTRDAEVRTGYAATALRAVVQGELVHDRA